MSTESTEQKVPEDDSYVRWALGETGRQEDKKMTSLPLDPGEVKARLSGMALAKRLGITKRGGRPPALKDPSPRQLDALRFLVAFFLKQGRSVAGWELAEVMEFSESYAYILLQQLDKKGWISRITAQKRRLSAKQSWNQSMQKANSGASISG
jgi:hypothetical protein